MDMCYRLHGKKNAKYFEEIWVYLLNLIVSMGKVFGWADILSHELHLHTQQAKTSLQPKQALDFYMSSYLLDGIYTCYDSRMMKWNWTCNTPSSQIHPRNRPIEVNIREERLL